jgi:uncharacterized membrane protein YjdF
MSVYATETLGRRPPAFWAVVGLKSALLLLLVLPLINPGWHQYEDKGMLWRIVVFPLAGLIIPVAWRLTGGRRPYPYLADGLLVSVPLMDVLWNTFNAYDRIWWWDDLTHLLNAVVIALVIGLWLRRYDLGPAVQFFLILGVSMTLAVVWELAEYPTFLNSSDELATAYEDTLSDLAFAFIGATFAAVLAARQPGEESGSDEPEPTLALAGR